jgi:type II secretory pathway component PulL
MKRARLRLPISLIATGALAPACLNVAVGTAVAEDDVAVLVADQVRSQGFTCAKAISAQRDEAASQPNQTVYVLKCEGATYRVVLIPDQAAKVTKVE